jgi:Fe2+ or Zn2+ uptake regulation protein
MEATHSASEQAQAMLGQLKRAGLRLTPQRLAIVEALAGDASHPTAQELFERLRPAFPTMSFATVYSTLDTLAVQGLVGSLRLGAAVRFDPNVAAHHHGVCDACGAVVDLPALPLSHVEIEDVRRTSGFAIRAEERTYRGRCGLCSEEPGKT